MEQRCIPQGCNKEIEEESQIESSMPLYLEHMFGTSVGMNLAQKSSQEGISSSLKSHTFLCQEKKFFFSVPESQGFNVVGECDIIGDGSPIRKASLNLADVKELVKEDHNLLPRQRNSPTLSLPSSNLPNDRRGSHEEAFLDSIKHFSKTQKDGVQKAKFNIEVGIRKIRKWQSKPKEETYDHPLGCVFLKDCVEVDKTVDMLALVLQGQ